MGWVIMGIVLFVLLNKQGRCAGHRRRHRSSTKRRRHQETRQSASEIYRMQAEAEDMNRRMRVMERMLDPRDDRLRRDIQNL